jgi:F-type H+-transporting ATPase subunit b
LLGKMKHPLAYLLAAWVALGVVLSIVLWALKVENFFSTAWAVPDFLILATLLWWFMFKKTPEALPMLDMKARLKNRRQKIADNLESAEKAHEDAASIHREYTERLEKIEQEIAELKDLIKREGESEREKILAEANRLKERIKNEAEFTARQELRNARARLKQDAVNRAVEMAEEILKKTMTDEDRTRLLDEFLVKMQNQRDTEGAS